MSTFIARLSRGYASLVRSLFALLTAAAVLVAISAAVSLPVWWLADRFPRIFSLGVVALVLGGLVSALLIRRIRRNGLAVTLRRLLLGTAAAVLTVVAVAVGSPLAIGTWLVVVSGAVAYRLA